VNKKNWVIINNTTESMGNVLLHMSLHFTFQSQRFLQAPNGKQAFAKTQEKRKEYFF